MKKRYSMSSSLWVALPVLFSVKKPMKRDVAVKIHEQEYKKGLEFLSVQPSSFVVLSFRSSSLSKSLWSLLAMVFLLLSSLAPFFSWSGNGITGYKKRKLDYSNVKPLSFSNAPLTKVRLMNVRTTSKR